MNKRSLIGFQLLLICSYYISVFLFSVFCNTFMLPHLPSPSKSKAIFPCHPAKASPMIRSLCLSFIFFNRNDAIINSVRRSPTISSCDSLIICLLIFSFSSLYSFTPHTYLIVSLVSYRLIIYNPSVSSLPILLFQLRHRLTVFSKPCPTLVCLDHYPISVRVVTLWQTFSPIITFTFVLFRLFICLAS